MPITGKAILGSSYPVELRDFFRDGLRISPAILGTLVQGLCSLAQGQPSIAVVKEMIWAINAMDPTKPDLIPLVPYNILPIRRMRHGSADMSLQNCGSNFSVVDRMKLADIFRDHTGFLDFSLEEVRQLDPILQALDLSKKFLSRVCIEETACSNNGVFDMDLTQEFNDRAYYLLR